MGAIAKILEAQRILNELHDIKKRPLLFAAADLTEWMESKLDTVSGLLDDAVGDLYVKEESA